MVHKETFGFHYEGSVGIGIDDREFCIFIGMEMLSPDMLMTESAYKMKYKCTSGYIRTRTPDLLFVCEDKVDPDFSDDDPARYYDFVYMQYGAQGFQDALHEMLNISKDKMFTSYNIKEGTRQYDMSCEEDIEMLKAGGVYDELRSLFDAVERIIDKE